MLLWTPTYKEKPVEPGWYFIKMITNQDGWERTETLPAKLTVSNGELEWHVHADDDCGGVTVVSGMYWETSYQTDYRRNKQTFYIDHTVSYNITHWAQVVFGG